MSSEIGLEIVAIKFVLGSFAHYDDDKERKEYIRSKINGIPHLDVYFSFTHEELGKLLLEKEKQRTGEGMFIFISNIDCLIEEDDCF